MAAEQVDQQEPSLDFTSNRYKLLTENSNLKQ